MEGSIIQDWSLGKLRVQLWPELRILSKNYVVLFPSKKGQYHTKQAIVVLRVVCLLGVFSMCELICSDLFGS